MEQEFHYAPFRVEAGKVREFARALGLQNPVYFDRQAALDAGYRDIPAPPTYTTVIDFWNERDFYQLFSQWGLDPNDILHGEQSFEYGEDIISGDVITAKAVLTDQFDKKDKRFYQFETTYRNQNREVVRIGRATLIERREQHGAEIAEHS
ncbi:MaoC family dehydratase N-terminal domain-containing protein [Planococcus sp. CP5-4]|uniref:FAS1-like dehydratase domain-containing protein n=1 Tax=unclassified Planococcus (in: firmicutes) TaxID=2662419 RepID=UPI001C2162C9|nr:MULTISPECIES: MaoC family dehydratase N-terminal domain-containing protein [unclassified Planococcus (in: firmicutes)]MBU9673169.1 MaoC family dehydratase N-terminal domain-containing protein [Planococcus sp. CP5-4_YE]MBW6062477.1 MaoC family dehydratase N-terminal domain-containing protein [Planococcus sp. CP5-4]